jgi:L-erythro-3,5-diaminohexanoate dehydrogenase
MAWIGATSPLGLNRVLEPAGVLPQAAWKLDPRPELAPGEVRIRVQRLNLDAASYRQLRDEHGADPAAMRAAVAGIIRARGKMHNPVTGSGGMLIGVVDEAGPRSPLGLRPGDRVASLVSLTLTPLAVHDDLAGWDGRSEQVPCEGHAILTERAVAAVLPDDLPGPLALAVLDVCGAPALTDRVVRAVGPAPVVAVIGASGKSGSLSAAAAHRAGAGRVIAVVPDQREADLLRGARAGAGALAGDATAGADASAGGTAAGDGAGGDGAGGLAGEVVIADARDAVALAAAVQRAGGPADVTVVCADVPGCEGGAILATAGGGTVIFFSMATSFTAAALTAEGMGADVTMLIGNGYVPGHADLALGLVRADPALRDLLTRRLPGGPARSSAHDGAMGAAR